MSQPVQKPGRSKQDYATPADFLTAVDKPDWLYPKDCILCLYSPRVAPGYEVWSWRRK